MKVLHILGELRPSGAETMLRVASKYFIERGVYGDILSAGTQIGPYAQVLQDAGFGVRHIPFGKSPVFFIRLLLLLVRHRYDVIHIHSERARFWLGMVSLLAPGGRVVTTVHNTFPFEGTLRRVRSWQRRFLRCLGVDFVSIGSSVRCNESDRFGLKTTLIPNWFDDQRFVPFATGEKENLRKEFRVPEDKLVISMVGNCSHIKNHVSAIRAIASMKEKDRPHLLHAGSEEVDFPERELARSLGVEESISFLGAGADVHRVLAASDAYLMPSLFEGFGIAAIEAIATEVSVIFSRVAGLKDFEQDFPGIYYAETPEEKDIRKQIEFFVAETPETRRSRVLGWNERARMLYGVRRGVDAYIALYRGELESKGLSTS